MRSIIIYSLLLIIAGIVFYACQDNFVTKEFTNGVVDENFFKDGKDAEQALTAVYDIISSKGLYREAVLVLGSSTADNIDEQTGDNGDYGTHFRAASDFRWLPDNPFSSARWYDAYKGVFRANILLRKLPGVEMDNALRERFTAEAKFLRAMFYWNLVIIFGDVPFTTEVLTREEYAELARTNQDIIYAQIEQDLLESIDALPLESNPVGRVTRGAALAFLGRVYLYQGKWQESAQYTKQVLDLGQYQLVEDYISMFNGKNENSQESVFELQSVSRAPGVWGNQTENFYSFHWSPMIGWANWFTPSEESKDLFVEGDIRRKSVLIVGATPPDSIDTDGDGELEEFPSENMNTTYFNNANVRKWLPDGTNMADANNFNVNYPIIRYAEVLLNYAEALNELGQSSEALESLNMVRERAQIAPVTETNQANLRKIIRQERRIELVYEGHRFFDLARWGLLEEELGPLGFVSGRHEYWPIPPAELDLMPNLTQYPGN